MKSLIREILHWTWCFPQTFLGFLYYVYTKKTYLRERKYKGSVLVELDRKDFGGVSLGKFIFLEKKLYGSEFKHEYGHYLQNLYLGPLYIIVIGIPSQIRYWRGMYIYKCDKKKFKEYRKDYFNHFPENWADKLGEVGKR